MPVETNSGCSFASKSLDACTRLLQDMDAAVLGGNDTQFREQEPGADYGMTGELEFFFCGEDPQPREGLFIRRLLHKNRLRKIHFPRDGEHLVVRESVAISKNGKRVALEAVVGENVESVIAVFHGWL